MIERPRPPQSARVVRDPETGKFVPVRFDAPPVRSDKKKEVEVIYEETRSQESIIDDFFTLSEEELVEDRIEAMLDYAQKNFSKEIWNAQVSFGDIAMKRDHFFTYASGALRELRSSLSISLPDSEEERQLLKSISKIENEVRKQEREVGLLIRREQQSDFLESTLVDIDKQLKSGKRHPRVHIIAQVRGVKPRDIMKPLFGDELGQVYERLVTKFEGADHSLSDENKELLQKAAFQMENSFFKEAAQTIHDVASGINNPTERARLKKYEELISEQVSDAVKELENSQNGIYDSLLRDKDISPERKERLEKRQMRERSLRDGPILRWKSAGKRVSLSKEGISKPLSPESIIGDEKVMFVWIQQIDDAGNVLPVEEYPAIKAVLKSTHSDSFFRDSIPPMATDVNEVLAGAEAVLLGADEYFPATVLRETKFGRVSIQAFIEGKDKEGEETLLKTVGQVQRSGDLDWIDRVLQKNKELIAIMQWLQFAQDAGGPNVLLEENKQGFYSAYSIDNGLINPSQVFAADQMSIFAAERGARGLDEPISSEVESLLHLYDKYSTQFNEMLQRTLPYDVSNLIDYRKRVVDTLLSNGVFPAYGGSYRLRDTYRKGVRRTSRTQERFSNANQKRLSV